MSSFIVDQVDTQYVHLRQKDGPSIRLPHALFASTPSTGDAFRILVAPETTNQPLPPALTRLLLNELLSPSP